MSDEGLILVIDDETAIRDLLKDILEEEGFRVMSAADGKAGIEEARRHQPSLVLLDLKLPHVDGYEVCRILRAEPGTQKIPIIFLTGKGDKVDVVVGLGVGGDDYITKPFDLKELVARVKAALRRSGWGRDPSEKTRLTVGPLTLDAARLEASVDGKDIHFTVAEFRILWALSERPGVILSRDQILDKVTKGDMAASDRAVDVHINAIRKKLGSAANVVQTVRGLGYRITLE